MVTHPPALGSPESLLSTSSASMRLRLSPIKEIAQPNNYIQSLEGEFSQWAFNEERAQTFKGKWRTQAFHQPDEFPLDLEIGTGNGYFFAHRCQSQPERGLVGIEIKFKPLIQSIRRALKVEATNGRMVRFNASLVDLLFAEGELNNIFIHHPDPWEKRKQHKHRLIQDTYIRQLFHLQRADSLLEFKTDSLDYFEWALERFRRSPYRVEGLTFDLHHSEYAQNNFVTHFEKIFLRKGQLIHYALLRK